MKKIKHLLMLFVATLMLAPGLEVFAVPADGTIIKEISIYSDKTSVTLGEELSEFDAYSKTEGITVEAYGENTGWAFRKTTDEYWDDSGVTAAKDADAHYGLRLKFDLDSGYVFDGKTTIYLNGKEASGYSYLDATAYYWTIYIDLGTPVENSTPEPDEPTYYNITINLNGAEWADEYYAQQYGSDNKIKAGEDIEVSCPPTYILTPPKLKEFDGYEINGTKYAPGKTYTPTGDVTVKLLWKDAKTEEYSVENDDLGITLDFTEIAGKDFELYIDAFSMFTDEFIKENLDEEDQEKFKEELKTIKKSIADQTKDIGTLLDVYFIYLEEDGSELHKGPFKIKIKMTEEMKKYNTFRMVYINDIDEDGADVSDEAITLTVNGDYLEGTLEHLSTYALVGSVVEKENPSTGDNVMIYIILSILSVMGLVSLIKLRKSN